MFRLHRRFGQQLRRRPVLSDVMNHEPWLSIIVPALNEAAVIEQTLAPLQQARHQGVEVILVDGGSDDDTRNLSRSLVDVLVEAQRGRANQMNAGAARARAPLLLFLHADTLIDSGGISCLRHFPKEPAWGRFDVRLSGGHYLFPVISRMMNWRSALSGIVTGDQGMVMHRSLFDAAGGFPAQPLMEDIALSRELKRHSHPVRLGCHLTTDSRRWQQYGVWRTVWLMWRLRLRYFLGTDPAELARRY